MMHDGKRHDRLYVRLLNVDVMLDMKYGIYIMPWEEYSMKYGIYIIPWEEYSDFNRTFAHSQFNKKKLSVYHKSYFPYNEQNGAHSREKERAMEWTKNLSIIFLHFCRCLNIVKNWGIIL